MGAVRKRKVQLIILCEDTQQEVFIRRFLKKRGWPTRGLRVEKSPSGRGAADQFVRERFPIELHASRAKLGQVGQAVVAMIDGDRLGVQERIEELNKACQKKSVQPRRPGEKVAVFVPTWNIETWFAYLNGAAVDEGKKDYPGLKRERDCQKHVTILADMCDNGQLRSPSPPSLEAACEEFKSRLEGSGS